MIANMVGVTMTSLLYVLVGHVRIYFTIGYPYYAVQCHLSQIGVMTSNKPNRKGKVCDLLVDKISVLHPYIETCGLKQFWMLLEVVLPSHQGAKITLNHYTENNAKLHASLDLIVPQAKKKGRKDS